jgi:hypothetical protein
MQVPSQADRDVRPQPVRPISAPHPEMPWAAVESGCPVMTWRMVFPGEVRGAQGLRLATSSPTSTAYHDEPLFSRSPPGEP